ncbi:helix-turn-helix domain-containing protein [Porphyromonas gingivalis]|uniref:Helix-turn-helix transcriptional regulator n=2 Tax=root TaxID=1 RepID=A0AAF0BDQ1_PORGN|nr:helix-turn-helix transcriptional regulator [Porphyromonas gingivalis]WCG02585.1 helix-turn-helix transcriptional regulator [Porphyromonas gingivalis]SJL29084.1 Helix-turn-helix [Porphyromonas gingivalis]
MGNKDNIEEKLGKLIEERRTQLKLSKLHIQRETGIHYSYYTKLVKGQRSMSVNMLQRICKVLGLEIKLEPQKEEEELC